MAATGLTPQQYHQIVALGRPDGLCMPQTLCPELGGSAFTVPDINAEIYPSPKTIIAFHWMVLTAGSQTDDRQRINRVDFDHLRV
jgi:hypothetical protein